MLSGSSLRKSLFLCACVFSGLSQNLLAEPGEWLPLGPDRALSAGLAVDANNQKIIYVAVADGLYKSIDKGATWRFIDAGIEATYPDRIFIDQSNSNRLFMGAEKITVSNDNGESWMAMANTPSPADFIQIAPANANLIYVAKRGDVPNRVTVTTDGGQFWTRITDGLPAGEQINSFAMDPTNSQHLYVSLTVADPENTDLKSVYYSTDGGENWNPASAGPVYQASLEEPAPSVITLTRLIPSPDDGDLVYGFNGTRLFRSADGGVNWSQVFHDEDYRFLNLFFDPSDSSRLFAMVREEAEGQLVVRKSTTTKDGVWKTITSGIVPRINALERSKGNLVASTDNGFFISADNGKSWLDSSDGMDRSSVEDVVIHPAIEGRLYATANGLFRSSDGGLNWFRLGEVMPTELFFHPFDPESLYVHRYFRIC